MSQNSIGSLIASIGADITPLKRNMEQAQKVFRHSSRRMQSSAKQIESSLSGATKQAKVFASTTKRSGKQATVAFDAVAGSLRRMAVSFLGVAAVTMTFREMSNLAIEFQTNMARVSTMLTATTIGNLKDIKAGIMILGPEIGKSLSDLAQGEYQVLSAGVAASKSLDVLRVSAKAAVAGATTTETAVDIITTALNAYGLSADHAMDIGNKLFTAVRLGKTTFAELAQSLGMVLPFATPLHISFGEIAAAMATMTASGINTAIATTALRGSFVAFITQAGKFRKAGINILQVISEHGLRGGLEALKKITGGNIEKMQEFIPDIRALTAVLSLAGKQSEKFNDNLRQMLDTDGELIKAFEKMADTFAHRWEEMKATLEVFSVYIGVIFLPRLTALVEKITAVVDAMNQLKPLWKLWQKSGEISAGIESGLGKAGGFFGFGFIFVQEKAAALEFINLLERVKAASVDIGETSAWDQFLAKTAIETAAINGDIKLLNAEITKIPKGMKDVDSDAAAATEKLKKFTTSYEKLISTALKANKKAKEMFSQMMDTGYVRAMKQLRKKTAFIFQHLGAEAAKNFFRKGNEKLWKKYFQDQLDEYDVMIKKAMAQYAEYHVILDTSAYLSIIEDQKQSILSAAQSLGDDLKKKTKGFTLLGPAKNVKDNMGQVVKQAEKAFSIIQYTAQDTAYAIEGAFEDMFFGKFKEGLDGLLDYFKQFLVRAIATALANPIVIPIQSALQGIANQMFGFLGSGQSGQQGQGGWLSDLLGTKIFGNSVGGYLGAGGMGFGIGDMMGGTTLSNLAGMAGGVGGYALGSAVAMPLGFAAASAAGSSALGGLIFSIMPIIGTIVGAVLGSLLSSLFGGKIDKTPQMGMTYSPSGATRPEDFKYGGTTQYGAWYWGEGGEGDISDSAQRQVIAKFKNLREKLKSVLEVMGGDLSKLTEDWASSSEKLSGEGSFKDAVGKWMADYVEFITNLDMTQFQKDGETIEDTINRIADAIIAFPDVVESFDRLIKAVSSGGDLDFQVDQFLWSAKKQAEDMVDIYNKMTSATDPADVEEYAKQLKQYLLDYYQSQVQFITDLQNRIEQLGVAMRSLTIQAVDYLFNYAQKMKSYGMTPPMSNKEIFYAGAGFYQQAYNNAGSASERFGILNQSLNFLYSYLDSEIADIKKKYQEMTEEAQKALDARREETRLALEIAKSWQQLADAIKETLYKLTTGTANPADIRERLGVAQSTVANLYQQYMSLTGEDKVKAAKELHDKIQSYLDLAQEAYQRPSTEYQTIYSNMISLLQMMESDSAARGSSVEDLQKELNDLTKQQIDLSEQMNAEIKSLTDEWQPFLTSMWDTAIDLYRQQLEEMQGQKDDLEAALKAVIGDQTVGEYIQNLRDDVVQALKNVQKAFIDAFEEALGHDIPGYATGGYVERRQLAWVAEKESEYIIPASKMDAVFARQQSANNSTITIAPSITVQIQGDTADPHRIAEEIELVLVDSIRHGNAGEAVKERMKYE